MGNSPVVLDELSAKNGPRGPADEDRNREDAQKAQQH
jgi:hypothetical protein